MDWARPTEIQKIRAMAIFFISGNYLNDEEMDRRSLIYYLFRMDCKYFKVLRDFFIDN